MKLSEILGWPDKLMKISWPTKHYQDGHNTAIDSCDREIDREALAKQIREDVYLFSTEDMADRIISTMPTWLKRIEDK